MKQKERRTVAVRRAERFVPLPAGWLPSLDVSILVHGLGFDLVRVLARYEEAQRDRTMRRWGDRTFLRWFHEARAAGKLHGAERAGSG